MHGKKDNMESTPYRVNCQKHGDVSLDQLEYNNQLMDEDSAWKCPLCGENAEWDVDWYEENTMENIR